jgi:hypothetical protein
MEDVPVVMSDETWDMIMELHPWGRDAVVDLLIGLVTEEPPALGMEMDSWGRYNKLVGDCFIAVDLRREPIIHFYVRPPIPFVDPP